jgi:hypothetical protein
MAAHHFVERTSQAIAGTPPSLNLLQPKNRLPTELCRDEVLVDDRIPPLVQVFEEVYSSCVPRVIELDFIPEGHVKTTEVGANAAGLSIAAIEEAASSRFGSHHLSQYRRWRNPCQDVEDAFGMKVPTKPMELGRQQHGIGVIELLGVEPPAAPRPADCRGAQCDLVQSLGSQ